MNHRALLPILLLASCLAHATVAAQPVRWHLVAGGNNHFYELVSAEGISFLEAERAASARTYLGLQGYLATIGSTREDAFVEQVAGASHVWIGAGHDGRGWRWRSGPEGVAPLAKRGGSPSIQDSVGGADGLWPETGGPHVLWTRSGWLGVSADAVAYGVNGYLVEYGPRTFFSAKTTGDVFGDGFESGDTAAWSETQPGTPGSSFTLDLSVAPPEGGTVSRTPQQSSYSPGTAVQLAANAQPGFAFRDWQGDVVSASNPVVVTMNADLAITARFARRPVLQPAAVDGLSITLTWTFVWPLFAATNEGYRLEESTTSPTSGFSEIEQISGRTSPQSITLNRGSGTYYYRVRAFLNQGPSLFSPYSEVRMATVSLPDEITSYATADNTLFFSTTDPSLANLVSATGDNGVGCNFSVLPYGTEYVCAISAYQFGDLTSQIAGRPIRAATLRLRPSTVGADFATLFGVNAFTAAWSSATVTWNNVPLIWTSPSSSEAPPTTSALPWEVDVTGIVRNWANGTWQNHGLVVRDLVDQLPPFAVIRAAFFESEDDFSAPERRPAIVVEFQ